jgi:hypothetical protein
MIPAHCKYEISFLKLILVKEEQEVSGPNTHPLKFIDGKCWKDENVTLDTDYLEEGSYLLFIEIDWENDKMTSEFVFNVYSEIPVTPIDIKIEE